jgi:magnesium transporter
MDRHPPVRLSDPLPRELRQNYVQIRADQTVAEAVSRLRHEPPGDAITYFYVTDADGRLVGVVSARALLFSRADQRIDEVMICKLVTVPVGATLGEACRALVSHKLLAVPVVDAERRVRGLIDVHTFTNETEGVPRADALDELFQRIGVHITAAEQGSPFRAFRRRSPWLTVNLVGGVLCALLAGLFEGTLNNVVALAFFIPVVLNMAESVSSQSVSLALHLLSAEKPTWNSLLPRVGRELGTGALLGLASGAAVAAVALLWQGRSGVALALLGGIGFGVMLSAAVGLAMPVALRLLHLDPRVAAGPVALAVADVLTIAAYLNLARLLLG